jgi:hypothetical protein
MTSWNENDEKRKIWIYNYLNKTHTNIKLNPTWGPNNYLKYIDIKKLEPIIEATQWGLSTRAAAYFTISKWLELNAYYTKNINNEDYTKNINIDYIKNIAYKLKIEIQEKDGDNELDEKEKENYRPQNYFRDILDNIDVSKIKSPKKHYEYLLLSLLILQPPVRNNFYISSSFIFDLSKVEDNKNYVYLNKEKNEAACVIQHDKVSNTVVYRTYSHLNYIQIENKELVKLLFQSYEQYKRKYLFEVNGHAISSNTLLSYLRSITQVEKLNIDMMRSSYINDYYEKNKSYNSRNKLAKQMRHSPATAMLSYHKDLK